MLSLRSFHYLFLLCAIVAAEMFGGWAVHQYRLTHDTLTLWLGIITFAGSFVLIGYVIWLVAKMRKAHVT